MSLERDYRDVVGRGFAFPFDVGSTGQVKWSVPLANPTDVDREAHMTGRIRHVAQTIVGQRVCRLEFGTEIVSSLFRLVQPALVATILRRTLLALRRWESRVKVAKADVQHDVDNGTVIYTLYWRVDEAVSLRGQSTVTMSAGFKETS